MHGPDLEKQNCISSKTNNNQTSVEKHPPACVAAEPRRRERVGQRLVSPRMGAGSGGTHLGDGPRGGVGFPHPLDCLALQMLPTMQPLDQLLHCLAAPSLFLWGLFPSPFCWAPLSFVSPFLTFLPSKGLAWTRFARRKKQLPALPLACCSGFMFDSNSTIYTAESSGPNRTTRERARNLSFSQALETVSCLHPCTCCPCRAAGRGCCSTRGGVGGNGMPPGCPTLPFLTAFPGCLAGTAAKRFACIETGCSPRRWEMS